MKKFISIVLSFIFVFSLAAWKGENGSSKDRTAKAQSDQVDFEDNDSQDIEESSSREPQTDIREKPSDYSIGSVVKFGSYEQDNDLNNGKEEIEWIVLDKKGSKALLISKYVIDARAYNTKFEEVTWETCGFRTWLNNTFIDDAFSASERARIATSLVVNDGNPAYGTDGGNNTNDKVFLLSSDEAKSYFSSDQARQTVGTAYAQAQGVQVYDGGSSWWLRTPGNISYNASSVDFDGYVTSHGNYVSIPNLGVLPALWVNL